MSNEIVIFGAGKLGKRAYLKNRDRVKFIVDNNEKLWGKRIGDAEIKSVKALNNHDNYTVLIASRYVDDMKKQLNEMGIDNYKFYSDDENMYFSTGSLIYNPYGYGDFQDLSEDEYTSINNKKAIDQIYKSVEEMYPDTPLFKHIEIETINRCNGGCSFCPVSAKNDIREYKVMSDELFEKIISELSEIDYSVRIALFSNNEPFLDPGIIDKHKYARLRLPNVRFHLFSNGTLISVEEFVEIMKYLDELIIDNYNEQLQLIPMCKKIAEYCEDHPEYAEKATIVLRKPQEILTTRGGNAPNRKEMVSYGDARCINPFTQMIIRPDGKVSLCCNDALGKFTLGDVSCNSVVDVWNNDRFKMVRKCLYEGRRNWGDCEWCDMFALR